MKRIYSTLTVLTVILIAACAHKSTPTTNATSMPKETETAKKVVVETPKVAKTTFQGTVFPLLQAKCSPCHLPSKGGNKADFENYSSAVKYSADMVIRIQMNPGERGFMPMRGAKLSADEIAVFKKWLSDGFLDK